MERYSIIDRASSMVLMGLTCYAIASANTSVGTQMLATPAVYSGIDDYGTDSMMLKDYKLQENKFKVEKEAQGLFGNMREATIAEQRALQDNIDKISVPTGINFWD